MGSTNPPFITTESLFSVFTFFSIYTSERKVAFRELLIFFAGDKSKDTSCSDESKSPDKKGKHDYHTRSKGKKMTSSPEAKRRRNNETPYGMPTIFSLVVPAGVPMVGSVPTYDGKFVDSAIFGQDMDNDSLGP